MVQDSRGSSQTFVNVSADDVLLENLDNPARHHRHQHRNCDHRQRDGLPGHDLINNFRMYNVTTQYSKGGLSVRSDNFVVEGNTLKSSPAPATAEAY